jgi:undecaprenyl-diphosphatase
MTASTQTQSSEARERKVMDLVHRLGDLWERRGDPHVQLVVTLAAVFTATTLAFLHVVEDYLGKDPIVRWDVELSRWLHLHSNGTLVTLFKVLTWAGNVAVLALLVGAVTLWLVRRRRRNDAFFVAASAAGIEVLNGGLKLLFHRPRPELAYVHLDTYSFPSGHAAGSAAIYAVVLYVLATQLASVRARAVLAVGYVVLVAAVGFSRLYLEAHYLSDVLAGISLGAAWAAGSLFVYQVTSLARR